ncbi:MAG: STAS domain-containing protein [Spirochaetales bacterium]|nr:STAS domain-containing protein [Spirochaetales bacterium]
MDKQDANQTNTAHIFIKGKVDYSKIEELKDNFIAGLENSAIILDVSDVYDFDFFFFQLFCSFLKTVASKQVKLTLVWREKNMFKSILENYGIDDATLKNFCLFSEEISHE